MTDRAATKTPALRFAGFSGEWEECVLGEIAKEVNRTSPTSTAPVMMITASDGFIEQSERYAFNNAGESLKKYTLLKRGELAYNHGASKLRPYGSCFALTTSESARIPFVYHCFSVGEHDSSFISIELNGKGIENQLRQIVSSGARMDGLLNISYVEYCNVELKLPNVNEQRMISHYFARLDELISLHQQKYDRLQNVKKAMLEKMFPKAGSAVPEVRFAGFTDDWEERKFGSVVITRRGLTYSPSSIRDHGIRVLRSSNIDEDIFILSADDVFVDKAAINIDYVKANDILITSANGSSRLVGKHALVSGIMDNSSVHGGFMIIGTTKEPYFINASMSSPWYRKFINLFVAGGNGAIGNLNKNDLDEQIFLVPSEAEQQKIGAYFKNLDELIGLQQRALEKLKQVKASMLEKMFV